MVVLVLGDVVGDGGCQRVRQSLPQLKKEYGADITVINGENSAEGNGILPSSAESLFDSGADVITTGNHGLRRREIYDMLDQNIGVIRPANYHPSAPGVGYYVYDNCRMQLAVINVQGNVYMQSYENAFACIDRILPEIQRITPNIIVDFHAEATSEKQAMGYYLDGKVSAVVGTHTHIPTADARVLPKGTGYITDLGMCGALNSILGVTIETAGQRMLTQLPNRFAYEPEDIRLSGAAITIDPATGHCTKMESFALV